ncbi:unnamed protein product [Lampetra fluviatilis]
MGAGALLRQPRERKKLAARRKRKSRTSRRTARGATAHGTSNALQNPRACIGFSSSFFAKIDPRSDSAASRSTRQRCSPPPTPPSVARRARAEVVACRVLCGESTLSFERRGGRRRPRREGLMKTSAHFVPLAPLCATAAAVCAIDFSPLARNGSPQTSLIFLPGGPFISAAPCLGALRARRGAGTTLSAG